LLPTRAGLTWRPRRKAEPPAGFQRGRNPRGSGRRRPKEGMIDAGCARVSTPRRIHAHPGVSRFDTP
jgi:hypothetical protein